MEQLEAAMARMALINQDASLEQELRYELQDALNNIEESKRQKGRKTRSKASRSMLLADQYQAFDVQSMVRASKYRLRRTFIACEYPPSPHAFADLKPILLDDLLVETVHSENYIVLKYALPSFKMNAKLTSPELFLGPFVEQPYQSWLKTDTERRTSCPYTTSVSASTKSYSCPLARFWPYVHHITRWMLVATTICA